MFRGFFFNINFRKEESSKNGRKGEGIELLEWMFFFYKWVGGFGVSSEFRRRRGGRLMFVGGRR